MSDDRDRFYKIKVNELERKKRKQESDEFIKLILSVVALALVVAFALALVSPGVLLVTFITALFPEGFSVWLAWAIAILFTGGLTAAVYGYTKDPIKTGVAYGVMVVVCSLIAWYTPSPLGHTSVAKSSLYLFTGFDDPLKPPKD